MKLRILSEDDVRSLISPADAVDLQAEAFRILAAGESIEGLRSFALSDAPPGVAIFNPSFLSGGAGYGIKVVSDFYENEKRGVPRMSALIALFDGETGHPRTVMEGGYITDLRTGAGTALAARHLARADSRRIALFGAGRVARNQIAALADLLPIERVDVVTRTKARGEAFCAAMTAEKQELTLSDDPAGALAEADIVVAATTSTAPVFDGGLVRPGTFVVAAGAHAADAREVDSTAIGRAAIRAIDSLDNLPNAGDLMGPISEGILAEGDVSGLADIVAGARPGRRSADQIAYYKSMGTPIQDLVTAQAVEKAAIERSVGTLIDIGGDHD